MAKKIVVRCKDESDWVAVNRLFLMDANDVRLTDAFHARHWEIVDDAPVRDKRMVKTKIGEFKILCDWTLWPVEK